MCPSTRNPAPPRSANAGGAGASTPRPTGRQPTRKWRRNVRGLSGNGASCPTGGNRGSCHVAVPDDDGEDEDAEQAGGGARRAAAKRARQAAPRVGEGADTLAATDPHADLRSQLCAASHLQAAHLCIGHGAETLGGLAQRAQPRQGAEVRGPRACEPARVGHATARGCQHHLHDRDEHRLRQHAQEMEPAVVLQRGAQAMVGRGATAFGDEPAVTGPLGLEVTHPRGRCHQDPCAHELGAPAEVDVVPLLPHLGVEPVEGVEQVAADEEAGGGHREDVADRVVLFLVELAPLDDRRDRTRLVDREPHGEQALRRVPLDQLRADDAGVRPEGLFDQQPHGIGVRRHVTVQHRQK